MDNKQLRKIGKKELLEILLSQAKRIEELENKIVETEAKLNSKKIMIDSCGSIAEASLQLNDIFKAAESSAEQYLFNVKEKCKKMEDDTKKQCHLEKEKLIKETEKLCKKREQEADAYLAKIELKAKELIKTNNIKSSKKYQKTTVKNSNIVTSSKKEISKNNNSSSEKDLSNNKSKKINKVNLKKVEKEL